MIEIFKNNDGCNAHHWGDWEYTGVTNYKVRPYIWNENMPRWEPKHTGYDEYITQHFAEIYEERRRFCQHEGCSAVYEGEKCIRVIPLESGDSYTPEELDQGILEPE